MPMTIQQVQELAAIADADKEKNIKTALNEIGVAIDYQMRSHVKGFKAPNLCFDLLINLTEWVIWAKNNVPDFFDRVKNDYPEWEMTITPGVQYRFKMKPCSKHLAYNDVHKGE